jgi:hypothetical protein
MNGLENPRAEGLQKVEKKSAVALRPPCSKQVLFNIKNQSILIT